METMNKNPNTAKKPRRRITGSIEPSEMLESFLDWCIVNDSNDYRMFKHLWETGFFKKNPITSDDLSKAVARREEKVWKSRKRKKA